MYQTNDVGGVFLCGKNHQDNPSVIVGSVVTGSTEQVLRQGKNLNSHNLVDESNNNNQLDDAGIENHAYDLDVICPSFDQQDKEEMYSSQNNLTRRHEGDVLKNGHDQHEENDNHVKNGHDQLEENDNRVTDMTMDYEVSTEPEQKRDNGISKKSDSITTEEIISLVVKLLVCLFCGMIMGLALEKGRVFEPRSIRCQFTYQVWIMMKMFLSAVATGLFCLATLSIIPLTKSAFHDARSEYISCLTSKGVLTATIGGMVLGAGMALSGACPGMVLAQVGAWVGHGSGLVTFVGCLCGAFSYGVVHPYISDFIGRRSPYKKQMVDSWISHVPFAVLALGLSAFMALLVASLEFWKPWKTEILPSPAVGHTVTWFMTEYAWPPYVAGILIGSLQIPLVLIVKDTIGGSSSYCTVASQVLVTKRMEEVLPYLAKFKRGLANWWQVFFVCGVILGAMVSSVTSHTISKVDGVGWAVSFVGGFVMLFGARLGGGCTSGHGLSGVGVLALVSFVAVAAMFGGGTIVGVIGWSMGESGITDEFCPL